MITPSSPLRDHRVSIHIRFDTLILFYRLAQFSVRENLLVVSGNAETKGLQEMMPDILKQVGPKQYQFLKNTLSNLDGAKAAENDDDDDVPNLVGTFEDAGKK